jgi:oxygen-independent coproporphyrinogen-3 oxidase
MEVNPATIDAERLRVYRDAGINRISMGAQSMDGGELSALGRLHGVNDIRKSYDDIARAGFDNINLDVMFGLPGQTASSLEFTLAELCKLDPMHVSAYGLTLEKGTPLYSDWAAGNLSLPDEDAERDMYEFIIVYLAMHGYTQYEISNFAKPGFECRHNLKYWQCEPYIGLGLAAHSYFGGARYNNTSDFDEYIELTKSNAGSAVAEKIVLDKRDLITEYIIMGLRLCKGIELHIFKELFDVEITDLFSDDIAKHIANGFLRLHNGRLSFTRQGISVSNSILCDFV